MRAAFERESSIATPEECRQVWIDQMPFFADDPAKVVPMLDQVVFDVEAHHGHDLGELLIVEGAGHFPFAETPERYWPPRIDWLNRTGSGR